MCFALPERNGVFAEVSCSDDVALLYRPLKQCNSIVIALDLRPAALQTCRPAAAAQGAALFGGGREARIDRQPHPFSHTHTHTLIFSLSPCFSLTCTLTQLQSCDTHHRFNAGWSHFPVLLFLFPSQGSDFYWSSVVARSSTTDPFPSAQASNRLFSLVTRGKSGSLIFSWFCSEASF